MKSQSSSLPENLFQSSGIQNHKNLSSFYVCSRPQQADRVEFLLYYTIAGITHTDIDCLVAPRSPAPWVCRRDKLFEFVVNITVFLLHNDKSLSLSHLYKLVHYLSIFCNYWPIRRSLIVNWYIVFDIILFCLKMICRISLPPTIPYFTQQAKIW